MSFFSSDEWGSSTVFRLKPYRIFLGAIVLVFAMSVVLCAFHGGPAGMDKDEQDHHSAFLCTAGVDNFIPATDLTSSLVYTTSFSGSFPQILEPHLPLFASSILKIPKSA